MLWRNASLWLGMYAITMILFWFESGSLLKGVGFGVVSATLKWGWSVAHKRIFHDKRLEPPVA